MRSTYSDFHGHKNTWSYSETYNVGLFFDDFKDQLNKTNINEAKDVLEKHVNEFYFKSITLHFGKVKLIIQNVDNATTTLDELDKAEHRLFIKK